VEKTYLNADVPEKLLVVMEEIREIRLYTDEEGSTYQSEISLAYPYLSDYPNEIIKKDINSTIEKHFTQCFAYYEERKPDYLSISGDIFLEKSVISLAFVVWIHGHGNEMTPDAYVRSLNINVETGATLELKELLKKEPDIWFQFLKVTLNDYCNATFNRDFYINDIEDFDIREENQVFLLTEIGIILMYDDYKPFGTGRGRKDFLLPYGEIIDYIDTENELWGSLQNIIFFQDHPVYEDIVDSINFKLDSFVLKG